MNIPVNILTFFNLPGLGRERVRTSKTNALQSPEQEEPFDLSQKSQAKVLSFNSDGECAKGSSCPEEEEEDSCYEAERHSPGLYQTDDKAYWLQELSSLPGQQIEESFCGGKEKPQSAEREKRKESKEKESQQEEDLKDNSEEHMSFRHFENNRITQSLSEYLYFQHRNKSLKELLERKMEKQAIFLGI